MRQHGVIDSAANDAKLSSRLQPISVFIAGKSDNRQPLTDAA
jgi:hypothetical protein